MNGCCASPNRERNSSTPVKKKDESRSLRTQINALLIEKAKLGKIVVRLKGGDPFIFGRGGEETEALTKAGIPFVVVPGVTSAIGVAAYAGIPLTHRDFSSTLSIVTGSNEKGKEDTHIDWEKIASRSGTLIFLMGARKLKRITENLMRYGKDPETPIAVIQWGTTYRQKTWTGTLSTIVDTRREGKHQTAGADHRGRSRQFKIALPTGTKPCRCSARHSSSPARRNSPKAFMHGLLERGAEPFLFPVIETVPPEDWQAAGPCDSKSGELRWVDLHQRQRREIFHAAPQRKGKRCA